MNSGTWRERALQGGRGGGWGGVQHLGSWLEPLAALQGAQCSDHQWHRPAPFISSSRSVQSTASSLTLVQLLRTRSDPTVFLISDCNQARILRGKGLQSVGLEQQQKAALGALQTQIDVVQCAATPHSAKCFIHPPGLDCTVKVLGLRTSFFFPSQS